jgi:hypothetical protein
MSICGLHCLLCDTIIFSAYIHDFVQCDCKSHAIDGGREYLRIQAVADNTFIFVTLANRVLNQYDEGSIRLPELIASATDYFDYLSAKNIQGEK